MAHGPTVAINIYVGLPQLGVFESTEYGLQSSMLTFQGLGWGLTEYFDFDTMLDHKVGGDPKIGLVVPIKSQTNLLSVIYQLQGLSKNKFPVLVGEGPIFGNYPSNAVSLSEPLYFGYHHLSGIKLNEQGSLYIFESKNLEKFVNKKLI